MYLKYIWTLIFSLQLNDVYVQKSINQRLICDSLTQLWYAKHKLSRCMYLE